LKELKLDRFDALKIGECATQSFVSFCAEHVAELEASLPMHVQGALCDAEPAVELTAALLAGTPSLNSDQIAAGLRTHFDAGLAWDVDELRCLASDFTQLNGSQCPVSATLLVAESGVRGRARKRT
jgi:hypothetical protein